MAIIQENPKTGEVEIRAVQTNDLIAPAQSHHPSKAKLPGGERYTRFTKWRRRIFAVIIAIFLVWFCYTLAVTLNIGGFSQAPNGPNTSQVQNDFKKATAPKYDEIKYLKTASTGTPQVENVEVGRVVTNTGEVSIGYSCEATADVKFSNSAINSTSKMRMKYSYNSILHTWQAGEISVEQSNYRPNDGPDMNKIQEDALSLLSSYDESSGTKMQGSTITRDGEVTKDGGEVTFTLTKAGAGTTTSSYYRQYTYATDLVKTMKVRVEWSEISGWVASVTWVGTTGEGLDTDDEEDTQVTEVQEAATKELECITGAFVQLTGTLNGNTLTTTELTKYTIDGQEYKTREVTLTGNISDLEDQTTITVSGNISVEDDHVTLTVL